MEIERSKKGTVAQTLNTKAKGTDGDVSSQGIDSRNSDKVKVSQTEVPSIRLSPEQIEEIHADEYSLTLFYATRVEPLSLNEIKREFPEPEPKKAQSVMERFVKVGLVQITSDGAYYSNYPDNYINYSHYRYDGDLEARKDSKVFQLMKEFTGKAEYWQDKTYFSMDAFYSKEQSDELLEMFKAIKLKSKEFANENAKKKTIRGLRFRRLKFFDMTFAFLFAMLLTLGVSTKSYAGGNDPHIRMFKVSPVVALDFLAQARFVGGGNDPTPMMTVGNSAIYYAAFTDPATDPDSEGGGGHDPGAGGGGAKDKLGGGGHDPADPPTAGSPACFVEFKGQIVALTSSRSCRLKKLIDYMNLCGDSSHPLCVEVDQQIDQMIQKIESESRAE